MLKGKKMALLLDVKKSVDYDNAKLSVKSWRKVKSDGEYVYFIPDCGDDSTTLLRVPKSEEKKIVNYLISNPLSVLVKKRRREMGLSQRELSSLSGISQMTISNIENGVCKKVNSDTVSSLTRTLGLSVEILYSE